MISNNRISFIAASVLISFACIYRVIPHLPNFAPLTGIALLSGAVFYNKRLAFLVPIIAMYISDFIINNTVFRAAYADHQGLVFFSSYMIYVYASFIIITFIGLSFLKKMNFKKLTACALTSSVIFFLVTNFGAWLGSPLYPNNIIGLLESYAAGLPFFRTSILADLIFSYVLFGSFYAARHWIQHLFVSRIQPNS